MRINNAALEVALPVLMAEQRRRPEPSQALDELVATMLEAARFRDLARLLAQVEREAVAAAAGAPAHGEEPQG